MFKLQAVETQGARWINENLFNSEVYATKARRWEIKKLVVSFCKFLKIKF